MSLSFLGGYLSLDWYLQASGRGTESESKYADWQVYRSETYGFGLRYPNDWEAKEVKPEFTVFKPQSDESSDSAQGKEEENAPSEYISLMVASNKNRGKTLCEEDQSKCSFHTNGIFGERTTTSEIESVFFSHGENDFAITLHRYDSAAEAIEGYNPSEAEGLRGRGESQDSYIIILEEMAESFRFTSQVTTACEKDTDCTLGIRLDKCCSCAEAFTKREVEANSAITPFEAEKDYSGEKMVDCSSVYCSPCPDPPSGAVCVSNRCQVEEE